MSARQDTEHVQRLRGLNPKPYYPLDGQENHVACLFCQRGLKEVPWELRQQFHKEASVYVSAGLFNPAASLEVRMEQLRTIQEKENIALVPREQVEHKMNGKWRSGRYIIRKKKSIRATWRPKNLLINFKTSINAAFTQQYDYAARYHDLACGADSLTSIHGPGDV